MEKNKSPLPNADDLPLALKKFMKYEYLVFYDEKNNNEHEIQDLKTCKKKINLVSTFGNFTPICIHFRD